MTPNISPFYKLEGTARYAGLLLPPMDGFDQGHGFFFALLAKFFLNAISAYSRPFLAFSSNLRNF